MADNNVFILFEEIKTALKGINGKLEALPKVAGQQPQIENNEPDLSPIINNMSPVQYRTHAI